MTSDAALFGSNRERALWTWAAVAVIGIYSTLGLARTLADELRNEGLVGAAFSVGMLLIGAAIVAQAFRKKATGVEIGILLGVGAIYLMLLARMGSPEERSHLIEYSIVALLVHEALLERAATGRRVKAPAMIAVTLTTAIGLMDETIQIFIPDRVFDWFDVMFNFLAAALAVGAAVALRHARHRSQSTG